MNRVILTPRGVTPYLSKLFKVSKVTIWKALSGRSSTKRAFQIRAAAIEQGGVETSLKIVKSLKKQ